MGDASFSGMGSRDEMRGGAPSGLLVRCKGVQFGSVLNIGIART